MYKQINYTTPSPPSAPVLRDIFQDAHNLLLTKPTKPMLRISTN